MKYGSKGVNWLAEFIILFGKVFEGLIVFRGKFLNILVAEAGVEVTNFDVHIYLDARKIKYITQYEIFSGSLVTPFSPSHTEERETEYIFIDIIIIKTLFLK